MKKRIYRRMPVNDFQPESIPPAAVGGHLVFAVDIAKVDMVAAFAGRPRPTVAFNAMLDCGLHIDLESKIQITGGHAAANAPVFSRDFL